MCELLIKAVNVVNADADKDRRGCYKRGMVVVIMPDGHPWGAQEGLPKFAVIKIPNITVGQATKYTQPHVIQDGFEADGTTPRMVVYRRRNWIIRWDDLPAAAQNKLSSTGELIIRAGTYVGTSDYSWVQVRNYFRNQETGIDDTGDISQEVKVQLEGESSGSLEDDK